MRADRIAMLAADTSRTRIYLGAMAGAGVLPSHVITFRKPGAVAPGQLRFGGGGDAEALSSLLPSGSTWDAPLAQFLENLRIPATHLETGDVNSEIVCEAVRLRPEQVLVYSGYGGVLVGDALLGSGKKLLHIHGGYLPDYKGSTTNYYSLLSEGMIGASAIFLEREIDAGPLLMRRRFPRPERADWLDHVHDARARAQVLVELLLHYRATGAWSEEEISNAGGHNYYVIHPVLRHIAILADGRAGG